MLDSDQQKDKFGAVADRCQSDLSSIHIFAAPEALGGLKAQPFCTLSRT